MNLETIKDEVAHLLSGKSPMEAKAYREYILKNEIYYRISRWGFEKEFHQELHDLHPKQRFALEQLSNRLESGDGAIVALVGPRGLGKTSVAAQFAIQTAWKNYLSAIGGGSFNKHVVYRKCAKVVGRYKPLYGDYGCMDADSLQTSLEFLCREQEYVVIDELHECDDMKYKRMVLTDLVDRRYAMKRPTVLIANQTAEEFEQTIGDSILSRLNQYGAILPCKWPSYRTQ